MRLFQVHSLNAKVHLLPLFVSPSFYLIDVYASAQAGAAIHRAYAGGQEYESIGFAWGASAGAAFNLSRHWGLFAEYGYLDTPYFKQCCRCGLNIRFGMPKRWRK